MKPIRLILVFTAVTLIFAPCTMAAEPDLGVRAVAGLHYTFFAPRPDDLEYVGFDNSDQTRFALWPMAAVELTGFDVAGVALGGGIGIQPMFLSRIVLTQLNPDDTRHRDLDISAYATVFAEVPIPGGLTVIAGPTIRLSYWGWDYYYDSEIGPDSSNSESGTYGAWGLMAGVSMDVALSDRLTIPLSVRLYPTLAYGFMMPVSVLAGFQIAAF